MSLFVLWSSPVCFVVSLFFSCSWQSKLWASRNAENWSRGPQLPVGTGNGRSLGHLYLLGSRSPAPVVYTYRPPCNDTPAQGLQDYKLGLAITTARLFNIMCQTFIGNLFSPFSHEAPANPATPQSTSEGRHTHKQLRVFFVYHRCGVPSRAVSSVSRIINIVRILFMDGSLIPGTPKVIYHFHTDQFHYPAQSHRILGLVHHSLSKAEPFSALSIFRLYSC